MQVVNLDQLKMSSKSQQNEHNNSKKILNKKIKKQQSQYKQNKNHLHNLNSRQECKILNNQLIQFVERPLKDYYCFFITGDILVELARSDDMIYEAQAAQLWNSIKPLAFINHNYKRQCLQLNFDPTSFQLSDYSFLIKMMQTMQNTEFYQYSLILNELQKELEEYRNNQAIDDQITKQLKYLEFQNFMENELIGMIDELTVSHNHYNYAVYNCIEGLDKKSLAQFTLSEKAVEVISGSVEEYKQQLQRSGWREHVDLTQRRNFSLFQILQMKQAVHRINQGDIKILNVNEELNVRAPTFLLKTTDGFDAVMKVNEYKIVKYFGDDIIGIVNIFLYSLEQEFLDSIGSYRNISKMADDSSQTLKQMNRYDMTYYEYNLQAENFISKYNLV